MGGNPYWEAAKWTFAVVGGGALAGSLVVGGYKVAKRVVGKALDKVDGVLDADADTEEGSKK